MGEGIRITKVGPKEYTIQISANKLSKGAIEAYIKKAKDLDCDTLTFVWEPLLGPYLTIEL